MTQEQIEKAAWDYGCEEMTAPAINAPLTKGFVAGAKWRINSVWHNMYENADVDNGDILLLFPDGGVMTKSVIGWSWEDIKDTFAFEKWAYVKDLIPTKEE